jgi:HSP20 family protein
MLHTCKPRWTVALPQSLMARSLDGLSRDVEQAFDQLVGGASNFVRAFAAPANLWEEDGQWRVEVELPGIKQEQIELTLEKNELKIVAERTAPEDRKYHHQERGYGKVERQIHLPETADPESIEAELRDGVLNLTFKKKPEAQPRKISVKVS